MSSLRENKSKSKFLEVFANITFLSRATTFIQDSELLKIEDILPFFPDFVLIDDFKQVLSLLHFVY